MLTTHAAGAPVIHAAMLEARLPEQLPNRAAEELLFSGSEALRLATRERLVALEHSGFWQSLLHPELDRPAYAQLLQQLSGVWPPIMRALRERAAALGRDEWLPPTGTARLLADLSCLRRLGHLCPEAAPTARRLELPRGDQSHLLGMAAMVAELLAQGQRVAPHVDARLGLSGEGRSFFLPKDGPVEGLRSALWRHRLDQQLRTRAACESAIRGAVGLLDLLLQHLRSAWVQA
ncbi:biliverdin-producing heme oxygenase [Ideonella livida]|uniref:Biliverdin-producing heme oxygenase n=1 Tax=Ideonella livida TaxID=2707176 RepID=A0A7C9PGG7_9BURK|nr:biliverdin-producing heme oxygenase [Ideonella livida]NDY91275.1 biliverdin-producing heme oxygenase [Ideonella livida]